MIRQIFDALLELKWKLLLIAAVLVTARCVWLWQPARQVELHQKHFLEAIQNGNWGKFYGFFDDGFRAPNGKDKTWALQESRMVLGQFLSLKITSSNTTVTVEKTSGKVRSLIRIEGNGMELAEMAKRAVNESNEPFEFTWKHRSWKPWDWGLVGVEHPLLHINSEL